VGREGNETESLLRLLRLQLFFFSFFRRLRLLLYFSLRPCGLSAMGRRGLREKAKTDGASYTPPVGECLAGPRPMSFTVFLLFFFYVQILNIFRNTNNFHV
jgi:hypothetical protein